MTVAGTNFGVGAGATTITFGSQPATNVSCTPTQCTAVSPPGVGTVDVVVLVNHLPSQKSEVKTVGVDAVLVCRKDLDEQTVYDLTKQLFLAVPRLAESDPEATMIDESYASAFPIPLHPGAERTSDRPSSTAAI